MNSLTYAEMPPELLSALSCLSKNVLRPAVRVITTFARATVMDNGMECDQIDRTLFGSIGLRGPASAAITARSRAPTGHQGAAREASAIGSIWRGGDGRPSTS